MEGGGDYLWKVPRSALEHDAPDPCQLLGLWNMMLPILLTRFNFAKTQGSPTRKLIRTRVGCLYGNSVSYTFWLAVARSASWICWTPAFILGATMPKDKNPACICEDAQCEACNYYWERTAREERPKSRNGTCKPCGYGSWRKAKFPDGRYRWCAIVDYPSGGGGYPPHPHTEISELF